jgi:23S rRNA (pseudouridine1915-N3)-methyltransferase
MRLHLAAVGKRPPDFIEAGCREYLKRLPRAYAPQVVLVPPHRKAAHTPDVALADEAGRIRVALPANARLIVLDEKGQLWTTRDLASRWERWREERRDVALVIGGSYGVARSLRDDAEALWSLSRLTLPHDFVRLIVIEQLYRAWSVLAGHPYHHGC